MVSSAKKMMNGDVLYLECCKSLHSQTETTTGYGHPFRKITSRGDNDAVVHVIMPPAALTAYLFRPCLFQNELLSASLV